MGRKQSTKQLAKFIGYMLGRQPDEFGLVLEHDGYVKIKELLKTLSEEEGWRYVRRSDLNEILLTLPDPPFEIHDDTIVQRQNFINRPCPVLFSDNQLYRSSVL